MKTIRLYCKTCNAKLTDDLTEESSTTLRFEDGVDMIAKNKFSITNHENIGKEIVIAIDAYFLKNHKNCNRFSGCCGSSGLDGMNKTCVNGHEVATEVSDCWTPHYMKINLDKVTSKEKITDYEYKKMLYGI